MSYKIPDKIQKMILEFEQKDINKIFKVGNTITFFIKNGETITPIKLGIIDNPNGDIVPNIFFAKNLSNYPIDIKGGYFQINNPNQDIRSGKFELLVIGKQGPDGMIPKKTKTRYTLKNIFKVDARDSSNNLVGTYYANEHGVPNDSNGKQEKEQAFIELLGELQSGESLILVLSDKSNIKLNYIDTKGSSAQFEYDKTSSLSNSYKAFETASSIELSTNPDDISFNEKNETISVKTITHHNIDGNIKSNNGIISNISDFSVGDASDIDNDDDDDLEKISDGKKAMEAILSDPHLQQAFFKQPSFLELFKAELSGREAVGTGIITVLNIVNNYNEKKSEEKLGAKFIKKEKVYFNLIREISIPYQDKNSKSSTLVLDPNKTYAAMVRNKQIDNANVVLENISEGFRVLVKDKTDVQDVFLCKIIKLVIVNKTVKEYPSNELVRVKFSRESPGYEPITTKQTKQPTINPTNK